MNRSPKYTLLQAKTRMEAYCAYQERCDFDIRKKLNSWNLYSKDIDIIIADLISNNFMSEERFAEAYVSGKFRIKKWGKIKIRQGLKLRKISNYWIDKALRQIQDTEYKETMKLLVSNKNVNGKNRGEKKSKLKRFLWSKGYETSLIHEIVESSFD